MRTIQREIVSALLFSKDGKLFLGKKDPKEGGVYVDCWHIPGGGTKTGETLQEALIREVIEETGLDIRTHTIQLIDDQGRGRAEKTLQETGERVLCDMHFHVYRVDLPQESSALSVRLTHDLKEFRWVEQKELQSLNLTPPSQELFKKLGLLP